MGNQASLKYLILAVLLLVVCYATYTDGSGSDQGSKASPLMAELSSFSGYTLSQAIPLSEAHHKMLALDDYIFADYQGSDQSSDQGRVNLYVGYYSSAAKVTAAHSPLVCFPGQGWSISIPLEQEFPLADDALHAAEITATLDEQNLYILYWFQAYHASSPSIYRNKLRTLYNQFFKGEEQNAFVRVSVPIQGNDIPEARKRALAFIGAFYPEFNRYMDIPFVQR
ncbi:exosortase C-terminal domain/associated protein EpsI [Desulfogranum mediterraneum]|uniref:exosortase C-terminal domain/associated protein EpsI n=1 Tax=Desulfogranum mediterraneum TaxID=160661 RepID=UPI000426B88D|nr:exosortase C-terminal domain/associated protein EpsI [Desulfogranum mediterraneum]